MKKIIYIIPLLLLSMTLPAQEVAISYEIDQKTDNQATMQIYLQSLTDQDRPVKAINFSLAMPEGCVKIAGQTTILSDAWTDYLQEVQMTDQLDLNYNNWHYSHRWQYGNADPGLPGTTAIIAPAQGQNPLRIMQINLEGSCADKLYLEQQAENPVNQMGDENVLPIEWTVFHPKTDLSLQEGLRLEIFPNPVQDHLTLHFEGLRELDYRFELATMDGKMLHADELQAQVSDDLIINMSHLPAAVYILSISKIDGEIIPVEQVKIVKK
jgi:hypothetical protein